MEVQFKALAHQLEDARRKAAVATAKRNEATARCAGYKLQAKSAQGGLDRYKLDATRYQWLRSIGVRFPGSGDGYLHGYEADCTVDQAAKTLNYAPSLTEQRATQTMRRERDPLNPVLPEDVAARMRDVPSQFNVKEKP